MLLSSVARSRRRNGAAGRGSGGGGGGGVAAAASRAAVVTRDGVVVVVLLLFAAAASLILPRSVGHSQDSSRLTAGRTRALTRCCCCLTLPGQTLTRPSKPSAAATPAPPCAVPGDVMGLCTLCLFAKACTVYLCTGLPPPSSLPLLAAPHRFLATCEPTCSRNRRLHCQSRGGASSRCSCLCPSLTLIICPCQAFAATPYALTHRCVESHCATFRAGITASNLLIPLKVLSSLDPA